MASQNHDSAIAFQDYIRTYSEELFGDMYYGFRTAQLATPHEGVKGELVVNNLEVGDNLARAWGKAFEPLADIIDIKPEVLKTQPFKVDFSICPADYEKSYLGMMRQKGQNVEDWPFQAYIMEKIMQKLNQEFEVAAWQGVAEASPSPGDYLRQLYDGYLKNIASAITAGDLTPVATGAISNSNAVQKLRDMWDALPAVWKEMGTDVMVPFHIYDKYRINYKDTYKIDVAYTEITGAGYRGIQFELGNGNTSIIPIHGMGSSGRVVIAPRAFLHYAVDDPADFTFNVEADKRELHFWMDGRMGVKMIKLNNSAVVVNDQA